MTTEIVLTDVTRMRGGRICLAGVDCATGTVVRPVIPYQNIHEDFLKRFLWRPVRPFTRLRLRLGAVRPDPPHTEDMTFDTRAVSYLGQLPAQEAHKLLASRLDASVASIFGAPIEESRYVIKGCGHRSLGTVRLPVPPLVKVAWKDSDNLRVRAAFCDTTGAAYDLPITDLYFVRAFAAASKVCGSAEAAAQYTHQWLRPRDVILRIGLARGWSEHPDRCYLQVTGIYAYGGPRDGALTLPNPARSVFRTLPRSYRSTKRS